MDVVAPLEETDIGLGFEFAYRLLTNGSLQDAPDFADELRSSAAVGARVGATAGTRAEPNRPLTFHRWFGG